MTNTRKLTLLALAVSGTLAAVSSPNSNDEVTTPATTSSLLNTVAEMEQRLTEIEGEVKKTEEFITANLTLNNSAETKQPEEPKEEQSVTNTEEEQSVQPTEEQSEVAPTEEEEPSASVQESATEAATEQEEEVSTATTVTMTTESKTVNVIDDYEPAKNSTTTTATPTEAATTVAETTIPAETVADATVKAATPAPSSGGLLSYLWGSNTQKPVAKPVVVAAPANVTKKSWFGNFWGGRKQAEDTTSETSTVANSDAPSTTEASTVTEAETSEASTAQEEDSSVVIVEKKQEEEMKQEETKQEEDKKEESTEVKEESKKEEKEKTD